MTFSLTLAVPTILATTCLALLGLAGEILSSRGQRLSLVYASLGGLSVGSTYSAFAAVDSRERLIGLFGLMVCCYLGYLAIRVAADLGRDLQLGVVIVIGGVLSNEREALLHGADGILLVPPDWVEHKVALAAGFLLLLVSWRLILAKSRGVATLALGCASERALVLLGRGRSLAIARAIAVPVSLLFALTGVGALTTRLQPADFALAPLLLSLPLAGHPNLVSLRGWINWIFLLFSCRFALMLLPSVGLPRVHLELLSVGVLVIVGALVPMNFWSEGTST